MLLGLGQDATENGQITGMQVSVFDTSDLTRPALVDRLPLGQGWCPALDDSRAFTYDPERRQATFAFTSYEQTGSYQAHALGIVVDESGSLRLSGRLGLGSESWATRVLTDGDAIYAVSETGVVSGDAETLERLGATSF